MQQCTLTACALRCLAEPARINIGHAMHTCVDFSSHVNGCQEMREERSLAQSGPCQTHDEAHELGSLCTNLVHNFDFCDTVSIMINKDLCLATVVFQCCPSVPVLRQTLWAACIWKAYISVHVRNQSSNQHVTHNFSLSSQMHSCTLHLVLLVFTVASALHCYFFAMWIAHVPFSFACSMLFLLQHSKINPSEQRCTVPLLCRCHSNFV